MTEPAEVVGKMLARDASGYRCPCPICGVSRGLREAVVALDDGSLDALRAALTDIDDATEAWLEQGSETSMSYAYLRDEVQAVVAAPWWKRPRRRLKNALRVVGHGARNDPGGDT